MKIYFNPGNRLFIAGMIFCNAILFAQEGKIKEKKEPLGSLKIKFNEAGDKYLQFGMSAQVWLRYIENNPGTLVDGLPSKDVYDTGLRRVRFSATAQLSKRFKLFIMLGINNESFISGGSGTITGAEGYGKKPKVFFHDAWNEFVVVPKTKNFSLSVGAGLHSWKGISRLTNESSSKMLAADSPNYNSPTSEMSDQVARQFGIFAYGEYRRFEYRFSLNKPFATNLMPAIINKAVDNNRKGKLSTSGYVFYQFRDKEVVTSPFFSGTFLGEKKIFDVGAGFYKNPDGTAVLKADKSLSYHDISVYGVDVFAEFPVGDSSKKMSVSIYSAFYDYEFGPNYLRDASGVMNPADKIIDPGFTGKRVAEGFGNARYSMGTGTIWHTQAGFLLPKFSDQLRIQPYVVYAMKDLRALKSTGHYYDAGINMFLEGHSAKISLQYSSRPLYDEQSLKAIQRAGEVIAKVQISL